jgi:hypothetical protein
MLGVVLVEDVRVAVELREETKGETGRLGMLEEGVQVEALEVRRGEMPGIGLEEVRRALLVGTVPGVMRVLLEGDGLEGILEMPCREGPGLRGMRVDHQLITRGLRGILMRDFRRVGIDRKGSNGRKVSRSRGRRDSHSRGRSLSLSNGLSQGHSRRVRDRVDLAEIIMPERHERRAIAVGPARALAVVADNEEEVDRDEIT